MVIHCRGISPPLLPITQTITIQSTQELLETFDPKRSVSSAVIMNVMTTEEERKSTQRISLLHYESNKAFTCPSHYTQSHSSTGFLQEGNSRVPCEFSKRKNAPNSIAISLQSPPGECEKVVNSNILSPLDDGYSTDSRSNTSISTSSPSSSSFSPQSTSESSYNSHQSLGNPVVIAASSTISVPYSFSISGNMQKNVNAKGHNLHGRNSVPRPVILAVKKKVLVEVKDTGPNLEERLRALTTIEEEEFGMTNSGIDSYKTHDRRHSLATLCNSSPRFEILVANRDPSVSPENSSFGIKNLGNSANGNFRAVPVEIVAPRMPVIDNHHAYVNDRPHSNSMVFSTTDPRSINSKQQASQPGGWKDYTSYFEKHSDIPLRNIASSGNGKFQSSGAMSGKDIKRQIETRLSTTFPRQTDIGIDPQNGVPGDDVSSVRNIEHSGHDEPGTMPPRQRDYPMTFDRNVGGPSHFFISLSDLRSQQHSSLGNDNESSSLPGSIHQDGRHMAFGQGNFDPHSHHRISPSLAQQYQHFNNESHFSDLCRYQHGIPTRQSIHHKDDQDNPLSSRTSRDEFISLSRSLSKQYMQQREMLQQQQQQQQQQHLYLHHRQVQQRPNQQQMSDGFTNVHKTNDTPMAYSYYYPEVLLRNPGMSSSTRSVANRHDRHSWHQSSSSSHQELNESLISGKSTRLSLDLGSVPQIQRQIRATSEMCLQMSKKHAFASSADIYKLFQGQQKPDRLMSFAVTESHGRAPLYRHSFHSTPNNQWMRSHPALNINNTNEDHVNRPSSSLRSASFCVPSHATGNLGVSNQVPLRVDHNITISPSEWPSEAPGSHRLSTDSEGQEFQRQSSGYSSETELQQIELNAKASRKIKVRDQRSVSMNLEQEFRPVNPSWDRGTCTGEDDEGRCMEHEPFYFNHRMVAHARALQSIGMPLSNQSAESDMSSPLTHRRKPLHSNVNHTNSNKHINSNTPAFQHSSCFAITNQQRNLHQCSSLSRQQQQQHPRQVQSHPKRPVTKESNLHSEVHPFPGEDKITQKQIINLSNKAVIIKSFVPSLSYSPVNDNDSNKVDLSTFKKGESTNSIIPCPSFQATTVTVTTTLDATKKSSKNGHSSPRLCQSSQSPRTGSNSSLQLSPVGIAQIQEVPFATNIISDENGDRLSTLV